TLELCRNNVESIVYIYNKVFHHEDNQENLIDFSTLDDIKYYIDNQRRPFHKLISTQRTLVGYASIEPSCWWLNNGFLTSRYKTFVQHEIYIYRMLYHINTSVSRYLKKENNLVFFFLLFKLIRINECSKMDKQQVENLRICTSAVWSSHFCLTQTKSYQIHCGSIYHRKHLIKTDLNKYEQCLTELHRTVVYLQIEHQKSTNRLIKYHFQRFLSGEIPENFVRFVKNDQADSIFIAMSAMYYSITQLAKAALALGTTIHDVFELDTTHLYRPFLKFGQLFYYLFLIIF
ncbi:unnamed protein product, partial [Rotaria sp. Silwood2]